MRGREDDSGKKRQGGETRAGLSQGERRAEGKKRVGRGEEGGGKREKGQGWSRIRPEAKTS